MMQFSFTTDSVVEAAIVLEALMGAKVAVEHPLDGVDTSSNKAPETAQEDPWATGDVTTSGTQENAPASVSDPFTVPSEANVPADPWDAPSDPWESFGPEGVSLADQIRKAQTTEALTQVWKDHKDEWTAELQQIAIARKAELAK